METYFDEGSETEVTETKYYLRSSVLGGQVVSELNSATAGTTFVYAGMAVLARQFLSYDYEVADWEYRDPSGASVRRGGTQQELDPFGADAGISAQTVIPDEGALASFGSSYSAANPGITYTVDGLRVSLDDFIRRAGVSPGVDSVLGSSGSSGLINPTPVWVGDDSLDSGDVDLENNIVTIRNGGGGHFEWIPGGPITTAIHLLRSVPQNPAPTPTPCPGTIPEHIGKMILRIAAQERIDATLLSVAMRHESSFGTNMKANPRHVGRGRNRRYVGADVGPMQTATNIWGKSPFIDGLSDPFGTVAMNSVTREYESFNGVFEDNVTLAARAFSMDILPRSTSNADAAGKYRGPADYQGRYNQYVREAPGDRQQLKCIAGRR